MVEVLNVAGLEDGALVEKVKALAVEERRLGAEVLRYLFEIDRRRLYLARGFGSLFEFAVRELGYTDAAAARRVQAMRLLFALPACEEKKVEASLRAGELSLSTLSTLQRFFGSEKKERQKTYDTNQRMALIEELKNKSSREAERVLAKVSPAAVRPKDFSRAITETDTLVRFTADEALMKKLTRLKELLSHQVPGQDMGALLHRVTDIALQTVDPEVKKPRATKISVSSPSATKSQSPSASLQVTAVPPFAKNRPRYIPPKLRATLLQKAAYQCEYTDLKTGRRCEGRSFLQIDHRTPVAWGGTAEPANLRVLCGAHNRFEAARLGLEPSLVSNDRLALE